jgi:hypothetical protein
MSQQQDPVALVKAIIDSNLYMVLGTADEVGIRGCRRSTTQ